MKNALADQIFQKKFASRVYIFSSEDSATKQEYMVCVKCVFSGVKFLFVVQECGLLLIKVFTKLIIFWTEGVLCIQCSLQQMLQIIQMQLF